MMNYHEKKIIKINALKFDYITDKAMYLVIYFMSHVPYIIARVNDQPIIWKTNVKSV